MERPRRGFPHKATCRRSSPSQGRGNAFPEKKQEYQDNRDRNAVEGVFGTVKTVYGLDRVMAHLQETAVCVIGVALLLSNLSRSLRVSLALLCLLFLLYCLPRLRSRPYLDLQELDRATIDELIDHIEIGERTIVDGQRRQDIKVFYRFVGLVE